MGACYVTIGSPAVRWRQLTRFNLLFIKNLAINSKSTQFDSLNLTYWTEPLILLKRFKLTQCISYICEITHLGNHLINFGDAILMLQGKTD